MGEEEQKEGKKEGNKKKNNHKEGLLFKKQSHFETLKINYLCLR